MIELNFPELIKSTRKMLRESQSEFGKRFDVTDGAVSFWESGASQAPYRVINFVLGHYLMRTQELDQAR